MNRIAELLFETMSKSELETLHQLAKGEPASALDENSVASLIDLRLVDRARTENGADINRLGWDILALRKRSLSKTRAA